MPVQELVEKIRAEIGSRGAIPFHDFMELALCCPVYGFYEKEGDIIGRHGDFYTSPSVGPLFGQLLALQFAHWLAELPVKPIQIVEAGAHDGTLARDILTSFATHHKELFQRLDYWIVEPSSARRERQRTKLSEFGSKVSWLDAPGDAAAGGRDVYGVIFSNELLDAMPVHRLGWDIQGKCWFEWGVNWNDGRFAWVRLPHLSPAAAGALPQIPGELKDILPDAFTTEVSPAAWQWWQTAARSLSEGRLLAIDYGLEEEQFFAPERREGTLRAYRRHQLIADVLTDPGHQDITAHVNFSALRRVGEACGLSTEPLKTQGQFLTTIFADMHEKGAGKEWSQEQVRQFQTLTHPDHLGRAFRVFVQRRA